MFFTDTEFYLDFNYSKFFGFFSISFGFNFVILAYPTRMPFPRSSRGRWTALC